MLLITACLLTILDRPDDNDQEKLQGTWAVVAIEQSGKKLPETNPIYKRKYVFEADRLFVKGEEGNKNSDGTFKLDASKTPKEIDLSLPDITLKGVYRLEGDELKLHLGGPAGGEDRPKDFSTKEGGSRSRLIVLRREKS
jgi:uncharacterized protein (TIGR03067 family)